jgi:hypothetical protein
MGALSAGSFAAATESTEASAIGQDAYIWGFPLVQSRWYFDLARQKNVALNRFYGKQHLSKPSDKAVGPNIDTLYGFAWLDLAPEPQLIHVPDTNDRYYCIQLIDAYANTFRYIGRRATGTKEGTYAVVGPEWKGTLPTGIQRIDAPTNLVLAFTRTLVAGDADLPAAQAIQRQYALAPLSAYPRIHPPDDIADADLSLFPIPHFGASPQGGRRLHLRLKTWPPFDDSPKLESSPAAILHSRATSRPSPLCATPFPWRTRRSRRRTIPRD